MELHSKIFESQMSAAAAPVPAAAAVATKMQKFFCCGFGCDAKWEEPCEDPSPDTRPDYCKTCMSKCDCKTQSKVQVRWCYNRACGRKWQVSKEDYHIRSECPLHKYELVIPSIGRGKLCKNCKAAGLRLEVKESYRLFTIYTILDADNKEVAQPGYPSASTSVDSGAATAAVTK
jgi:hypothetical protein